MLPTPYLLILGGICLQVSRRYGLHAWRSYFSLAVARALLRCEESESTLREADLLATLPMYDPGLLASWYKESGWV